MSTKLSKTLNERLETQKQNIETSIGKGTITPRLDALYFETKSRNVVGRIKLTGQITASVSYTTQVLSRVLEDLSWIDKYTSEIVNTNISLTKDAFGDFVYSTKNGQIDAKLKINLSEGTFGLPGGKNLSHDFGAITIGLDSIEALLKGNLIDSLEETNLGFVRIELSDDYSQIRTQLEDQYGRDRVYFARREFVDYFRPTKGLEKAVELLITGGATSEEIAKEIGQKLLEEGQHVLNWLTTFGISASEQVCSDLLMGKDIDMGHLRIVAKFTKVMYSSQRCIIDQPVGAPVPEPHGAFYFVILMGRDATKPSKEVLARKSRMHPVTTATSLGHTSSQENLQKNGKSADDGNAQKAGLEAGNLGRLMKNRVFVDREKTLYVGTTARGFAITDTLPFDEKKPELSQQITVFRTVEDMPDKGNRGHVVFVHSGDTVFVEGVLIKIGFRPSFEHKSVVLIQPLD